MHSDKHVWPHPIPVRFNDVPEPASTGDLVCGFFACGIAGLLLAVGVMALINYLPYPAWLP